LPSETNAQNRCSCVDGVTKKLKFGGEPFSDALIVPGAPGCTERNDEVVVIKRGKVNLNVGIVVLIFGDDKKFFKLKTVVAQALPNRSRGTHVEVLNDKSFHRSVLGQGD
jgi:hypothetical protein